MHINFNPDGVNWNEFLVLQTGSGAYFSGRMYQRGAGFGSVMGSIFRFLLPMLKSAGKEIGLTGLAAGSKILGDVAKGKNIRNAVVDEASEGLRNLIDQAQPQEGLKKLINKAHERLQRGTGKRKKRSLTAVNRRTVAKRPVKRRRVDALGFY